MNRLEQAVELEKELISRMPWLALTFSGKPTNSKLRTLATISHLTRVTREERRMISVYIKNAWKTAEGLRAQLNELVSEFVKSDTDKRRKMIHIRYVPRLLYHEQGGIVLPQQSHHTNHLFYYLQDSAHR